MNGLLYKNLYQNRLFIIISTVAPSAILILMMFFASADEEKTPSVQSFFQGLADSGIILRIFSLIIGYMIAEACSFMIISCDEIKKWAFFSVTTPTGIKGQLYVKYVIIFMMCGLTMMCTYMTDLFLCSVTEMITDKKMQNITSLLVAMFYIQIFMKAVDLPFAVRFGTHKGSSVKMAMILGIFLIFIIYLLFGPLPADFDSLMESIYKFIENLNSGDIPEWLFIIFGIFPVISTGGYIASYLISCRLYLKGVESYDK